ncbi:hypothetical protein O7632_09750 [Solwaraspora sp. WMMD406]|uniref:hypothetical protein n=1 Tax=Solwaraspora sp. WMMD406 TaxID=3016095 RepID=UPI002417E00B|nr:hypothetical protein [Solwaraspora sp. WMMD406]MDG4764384.1 hypothetical protein [Solwaraspora sp. WMMD406]
MFRPRLALLVGTVLLCLATVIGCCAPAFLAPRPPWRDPVAEQVEWNQILLRLLATSGGLLLVSYPLLAYGSVGWRMDRCARVEAEGQCRAGSGRGRSRPGRCLRHRGRLQ